MLARTPPHARANFPDFKPDRTHPRRAIEASDAHASTGDSAKTASRALRTTPPGVQSVPSGGRAGSVARSDAGLPNVTEGYGVGYAPRRRSSPALDARRRYRGHDGFHDVPVFAVAQYRMAIPPAGTLAIGRHRSRSAGTAAITGAARGFDGQCRGSSAKPPRQRRLPAHEGQAAGPSKADLKTVSPAKSDVSMNTDAPAAPQ